ncbi:hypothetical protein HEK616_09680 [Streptomyces nigrescens]|uniref:Integral membrane protein n=1 Tax=Streptomyces nigrescens TaxID=1920 RepID=A0ABN6QS18_STRNI|nr:hypothetical protein [Streptomyces nigrescens]BDM67481.1 hypothetical protein HEK616_09680 [Streptomyces nigrescens]
MDGPIFGLCSMLTLAGTAIALIRAVTQRRRNNDYYRVARHAHVLALASSFVGSMLAIPAVADVADRATTAELSSLVSDIAAVIFCASLQVLIIDWEYDELPHDISIACRIGFVVVVSGLLIWQFRRTNPARLNLDLSTSYAQVSDVRTYMLTYLSFFAAAGAEVAMRATRLARGAWERGLTASIGLAVAAAGATLGVLYAVSRGGYVLAYESGHAWPLALDNVVSPALAGLSIAGVAAGLSIAVLSNSRRSQPLRRSVNV